MISSARITLLVTFLQFAWILECAAARGTPWATPDQEALDEVQDAEILKAVVTSMQEWEKRQVSHRRKRADSSVCYPGVGCFQDSGPFGYLDMLPSPPEEVSTRFFLYSGRARGNIPVMDVLFTNLTAVWPWASKAFNISAPTKVIVHGFGGSCNNVWVYEMRSALMTVEECNVICVDWEAGAVIPNYVRAAANTRLVGKQLSMLLEGLNSHLGLPFDSVHVIGFSLGAHVAGFAGAELKNLSRITGLDPAAPLFESQDPRARLDSSDAMFVDVIHSNGENLILGGLGSWQPMGHVDFYPNGGRMQKGCSNLFVCAVTDILWSASDVEGRSLCNHRRAYKFFTDSVSHDATSRHSPANLTTSFWRKMLSCNGDRRCGNMGYYADRSNGRGTLFLITREEEPFCGKQQPPHLHKYLTDVDEIWYWGTLLKVDEKDDDELKVGSSLARIAVPHPVLQEPKNVQIMYTAYSGWISSGLASWSIDKVTLTDSFGKSMSVCKKGLVLESDIPVNLPLYPGECNPPRENGLDKKVNWTTSPSSTVTSQAAGTESEKKNPNRQSSTLAPLNGTENITKYNPTPVVHIGDELINKDTTNKGVQNVDSKQEGVDTAGLATPQTLESLSWQPLEYLDNSNTNSLDGTHNKRENSRAFSTHLTTVPQNRTLMNYSVSELAENNTSMKHNNSRSLIAFETVSDRSEIKEPVLIPTSTSHPSIWPWVASATMSTKDVLATINSTSESLLHGKPEITEPVLNPKTTTTLRPKMVKPREITSTDSGSYHEHNIKWMPALDLNPPPVSSVQTWQHWIAETTASNSVSVTTVTPVLEDKSYDTLVSLNETNGEGTRLPMSPPTKISKKSHSSPIMIQFFPRRLAAILAQAERYARLTFSFPMAAMSKLGYYKSRFSDSSEADQATSASSNGLYILNTQIISESSEDSNRRNPSLQNQRRPKHFTTVRPTVGNVNTNSRSHSTSNTFEKIRMNSGKAVSSDVTTEASYNSHMKGIPAFQPKVDYFGNSAQMKDTTQNFHIFVPYTYAYVAHKDQDVAEDSEMPRYIPLLRYPHTTHKSKYEIQQNYNRPRLNSNDNHNLSEKPTAHISINSCKDDGDYNYFSIFHQYPIIPER